MRTRLSIRLIAATPLLHLSPLPCFFSERINTKLLSRSWGVARPHLHSVFPFVGAGWATVLRCPCAPARSLLSVSFHLTIVLVSWFLSMSVVVLGSSKGESRGPPESDGSVIPYALILRAGIRSEAAVVSEPRRWLPSWS